MWEVVRSVVRSVVSAAKGRRNLLLENLALRHPLAVFARQSTKPQIKDGDRLLWVGLRQVWPEWKSALYLVQPATVVKWHRAGFRRYWRFKSRPKGGRPRISPEVRQLIRDMWNANPTWGKPRIQAELAKLGITVSDDRRRNLHVGVTDSEAGAWTARQLLEAFPIETAPRFLVRDNDSIFRGAFSEKVKSLGIEEIKTAIRSPWQNSYCERLIGSIRRECLDHVRPIEPPEMGQVIAFPKVGGLHHLYGRKAAA